jgi:hypothetical protein
MKRNSLVSAMMAAMSQVKELAQAGRENVQELMAGFRRHQLDVIQPPTKRRRGLSAKAADSTVIGKPRRGRAGGPGSINAMADGLYLARTGQWEQAANMLSEVDAELSARYRRFASGIDIVPPELAGSPSFPFTDRLAP